MTSTTSGTPSTRDTATVRSAPADAGATVWFTGLPSSGKSTLAEAVATRLGVAGRAVEVLDGDEVRTHLSAGLGFSRADRDTHVTRVGFVAELLARHGVVVLVPVIAPYAETREQVRTHHARRGTRLLQVHVAAPVETCAQRDVKGLYARARAGELTGMTGVDDPYEVPTDPDLRWDTSTASIEESVAAVLRLLTREGVL